MITNSAFNIKLTILGRNTKIEADNKNEFLRLSNSLKNWEVSPLSLARVENFVSSVFSSIDSSTDVNDIKKKAIVEKRFCDAYYIEYTNYDKTLLLSFEIVDLPSKMWKPKKLVTNSIFNIDSVTGKK